MSVNVLNVYKMRRRLEEELVGYCGLELNGEIFEQFTNKLAELLPKQVYPGPVFQSTLCLLGRMLTHDNLKEFVWRLAGNMQKLKDSKSVLPWTYQDKPEFMPVQVLNYEEVKTRKGDPAASYKLRILAGSACPMIITKMWAEKFISFLAGTQLGFSRKQPYSHPSELVRLQFLAQIDQDYCKNDMPGFDKVASSSSCLNHNKKILKARLKIDPPCPFGYTHDCYRCYVGYDQCPAAVHPETYK